MTKSDRRLFDAALIVLGFVLIGVVADISLLHGTTALRLAMSLITWLMCSLPVAMLIGHCALSEE
jgi:hypothetical protein